SMSRLERARALLNDSGSASTAATSGPAREVSGSFDSSLPRRRFDGGGGETSSGLPHPSWGRLLNAVSHHLAQRFGDAPACDGRTARVMAEFVLADAAGGGSQMDLRQCFRGALEAMELSDKSAWFVLISKGERRHDHDLSADDVMLTTQTWRSLVVTSLRAAASELCDRSEREQAIGKLRADRAFQVFKLRDAFVRDPFSPQKMAALYFDLRARSLEAAPLDDDGSSSGLAASKCTRDAVAKRSSHVRASSSCDRSNERSKASLAFLESRCRSGLNDGYASEVSVISI
ncbi:unnamed protein product, partial [Prorocentrum cordatum]